MNSTKMRSNLQKVTDSITKVYQNELAAKILDGLDKLYSKYENSAQRWIWELI